MLICASNVARRRSLSGLRAGIERPSEGDWSLVPPQPRLKPAWRASLPERIGADIGRVRNCRQALWLGELAHFGFFRIVRRVDSASREGSQSGQRERPVGCDTGQRASAKLGGPTAQNVRPRRDGLHQDEPPDSDEVPKIRVAGNQ